MSVSLRLCLLALVPPLRVRCCRARGVPGSGAAPRACAASTVYDSGVADERACGTPGPAAPAAADADEGLISYDTLSDDFKAVIDLQLAERNKERILSGQPSTRASPTRGGVHG